MDSLTIILAAVFGALVIACHIDTCRQIRDSIDELDMCFREALNTVLTRTRDTREMQCEHDRRLTELQRAVEAIGQGRHNDALRQRTERVYHELSRPEARRDHSQG